ncbi:MAG: hypothetical protein ABEJ68_02020 [Halobacteriaceae archaeon]
MPGWECAIEGCGRTFGGVEDLLFHQVRSHQRHDCRICDAAVPEGYFAIRHVLGNHSRAEYVRHYDADSDDIRVREDLISTIEDRVDVPAIRERLQGASATGD